MTSDVIFKLRKQGRSSEALDVARQNLGANASDIWFLRAYAWVLYDQIKAVVDRYEAGQLSATELNNQFTPCMREFVRFADLLRRDTAFSQMLRLSGKVSKDWREFLGFARWAGIDAFSDEDRQPFVNDKGKTIDSLEQRFRRAICREAVARLADGQSSSELIDWGLGILDKSLAEHPNDQWLNYYQSKAHLARGEDELAIQRLALVLRRQARAAWTWALLGEILEKSQPDDALVCLAYATQLAREEQEVAKIRIHLANRLALAERYGESARQISLALKYREQAGYKIPQELQQLASSEWYARINANGGMQDMPDAGPAAMALLRNLDRKSLAYVQGVVDHVNNERALSYVATGVNTGIALKHASFPQIADLVAGTIVEVGRAEPEGPPLDWRLSDAAELPGLCETLSGRLERHEGKAFAFIRASRDDIFVPPDLAKGFDTGQTYDVSCLAVRRKEKTGKIGWRAVQVFSSQNDLPVF